jgi:hypothetical protein
VEKRWARAVGNLGLSVKWENEDISPVSKPEKPDKPDKADDADTEEDADA